MKLYTKTGDRGETGLIGGQRVPKDHPRVAAYGDVDETNAAICLAIVAIDDAETVEMLRAIQSELFVLGAQLANPSGEHGSSQIRAANVEQLERWIDIASAKVEPLESFILPGGGEAAARLHLARTVCRRAERRAVALAKSEPIDGLCVVYLNRLSDLLFALSRQANHAAGIRDVPWIAPSKKPE